MDIKKLYKQADEVYHAINYWIGEGEMAVSDHLSPNMTVFGTRSSPQN